MNVAADLRVQPNDPKSPVVASEIVTTSVSSRGMGQSLLDRIRAGNPDIRHARSDQRGYTLLSIDDTGVQATFRATPHPALPGSVLREQSRWQIQTGLAGVQAA